MEVARQEGVEVRMRFIVVVAYLLDLTDSQVMESAGKWPIVLVVIT